ncbi:MAG: hypothetical protein WA021_02750 [Minisyncoccia bacterium]
MPVSLKEFRTALGTHAEGISDDELQQRLDYMDHAADVMYAWWQERKEEPRHATTGIHAPDMQRVLEGIRLFIIRNLSRTFLNPDGSLEQKQI